MNEEEKEDTWKPTPQYEREVDHWMSIALWPDTVCLGRIPNISEDTHGSKDAAWAVEKRLRRDGLGGDGKIFPINTFSRPVYKKKFSIIIAPCSEEERDERLENEDYDAIKALMDAGEFMAVSEHSFATEEEMQAFIEGYEAGVGYLGNGYWIKPGKEEDDAEA